MSDEALEIGRRLFAASCRFFHAAQRPDDLPARQAPEIAFAGRSNVGKSSLLNALTGQKALARTSKEPGRTQQLNFFALGPDAEGRKLVLVDMPGYGFARVSASLLKQWSALIRRYLRGRADLATLCYALHRQRQSQRLPRRQSVRHLRQHRALWQSRVH